MRCLWRLCCIEQHGKAYICKKSCSAVVSLYEQFYAIKIVHMEYA